MLTQKGCPNGGSVCTQCDDRFPARAQPHHIPHHIHAYLTTYMHAPPHTRMHTLLRPVYNHAHMHTLLRPVYNHSCLTAYMHASPHTCMPHRIHACMHCLGLCTTMHASPHNIHACLAAYMHASQHTHIHTYTLLRLVSNHTCMPHHIA